MTDQSGAFPETLREVELREVAQRLRGMDLCGAHTPRSHFVTLGRAASLLEDAALALERPRPAPPTEPPIVLARLLAEYLGNVIATAPDKPAKVNRVATLPFAEWLIAHGVSRGGTAGTGAAPPDLRFSDVNLARCTAADGFGHALDSWSIAEWTNAAAGEMGEACNLAKKLLRHRDGVAGNKKPEDQDVASLRLRLADVVIYANLAMRSLGYDLNDTVCRVFNRKSDELKAPYRVSDGPLVHGGAAQPPPSAPSLPDTFVERAIQRARMQSPEGEGHVMLSAFEASYIRQKYAERNPSGVPREGTKP